MSSTGLALSEGTQLGPAAVLAPASSSSAVREFALAVYDNLAAVESVWRGFQNQADCTAFQTFEWLSTWQRHIGSRDGVTPCVVVARDRNEEILFILPLAVRPAGFARELVWLGSELCDYNAPLLAADCSTRLDADKFKSLWHRAIQLVQDNSRLRFDMIRLDKMPETVRGQQNPMLALPTILHSSGSYATPLAQGWDAFYAAKRSPSTRRRDRTKRNRLAELGEIKFITPETARGALDALDVLIEQKSAFFARRGIPNLFARPGYVDFYREFASEGQAEGLVHVSQLQVGAQVVAANFGLTLGGRYYYVLSSYTDGEMARLGPGATHLHELMRYAIDKQFTMFDFTIGDERYKLDWCDGAQPLHDHVSVSTWRGALVVAPAVVVKKLKRKIKQSPLLWAWFSKARSFAGALAARSRSAPAAGAESEAT
jgi:CelD/BcsL family acetyltransferase involved in cellulose biosynthesis